MLTRRSAAPPVSTHRSCALEALAKEPTLILRRTLHDGAFLSRFWISIVEFCCAKKVFEWNSLEAHPAHSCVG